jgi:glycine/D-amino acid oxidase-like deaminating enzyme
VRTRYGASPWVHTFPSTRQPEFPRIRGEHTADVAIIGGGLTGCATAYACAAAGLKVLLLERNRVGQGSAGRSAGLLLSDPRPPFRDIVQAHGVRAARRVFESWRRAAVDGAALLRRLGVAGGVEAHDSLIVASRDDEKALRRELASRDDAGLDARWLVQKQIRQATGMEATAGIRLREGYSVDPYRACLALGTAARKRGAALFERSHVRKVKFGRKGVEVVLDGASVRAETAIVTTGLATAEFKSLRRHFKRRETYLVLAEPMPIPMRRAVGPRRAVIRDWRSPRHRIRFTADGRILIAGADQDETPENKRKQVLVQRTGQLMYELLTMYPAISGLAPEFGWDLSYGETADGLMYIGPHRNYPHHLFALGGDADSLTDAFLAARVLARAAAGEPEKGDDVFGWTR